MASYGSPTQGCASMPLLLVPVAVLLLFALWLVLLPLSLWAR